MEEKEEKRRFIAPHFNVWRPRCGRMHERTKGRGRDSSEILAKRKTHRDKEVFYFRSAKNEKARQHDFQKCMVNKEVRVANNKSTAGEAKIEIDLCRLSFSTKTSGPAPTCEYFHLLFTSRRRVTEVYIYVFRETDAHVDDDCIDR